MPIPKISRLILQKPARLTKADLINAESELGREIFGSIPAGHRREFFHHDKNIWIFHESWPNGPETREMTVRYEVRMTGVFKKPLGGKYKQLEGVELENFVSATKKYLELIKTYIYDK
jgi:hypothetical protein